MIVALAALARLSAGVVGLVGDPLGRLAGVAVAATLAAYVVVAVIALALLPWRRLYDDEAAREYVAAAQAVDALIPMNAVVLVHDAGAVSVFAHRRAADMVGLKTPASIEANARWTWPSCGQNRADAIVGIIKASGAGYLVTRAEWDRIFGFLQGLRACGVILELVRRPPVPSGYTIWRLSPPRHLLRPES